MMTTPPTSHPLFYALDRRGGRVEFTVVHGEQGEQCVITTDGRVQFVAASTVRGVDDALAAFRQLASAGRE